METEEENKSIYLRHSVCSNWYSRNGKFSMGYVEKQNSFPETFSPHQVSMVLALQLMWCCSSTKYSNKAKDVDTCKSLDTSPQCSVFKIMEHLQGRFRLKGTLKNSPLITFERFLSSMNYLAYYKVWILTKHIEMVIKLVRFLPITDNLVVSESICKKLYNTHDIYTVSPV